MPSPEAQPIDLVFPQLPPLPRSKRGVTQLPDRAPDEPLHGVPDTLEHLPHLVGLPLTHDHPPPRVHPGGGRAGQFDLVRDYPLALDNRSLLQPGAIISVRDAPNLGHVLAQHPVTGVRHSEGKLPVVGQDHQAFGVVVEPAHGEDPLGDLATEQVEDRRPPLRVLRRRHKPPRLVEKDISQALRGLEALPVDLHRVGAQVGLVSQFRGAAVDGDPALADQLLSLAPGAYAGAGDELLQALRAH